MTYMGKGSDVIIFLHHKYIYIYIYIYKLVYCNTKLITNSRCINILILYEADKEH